MRVIGYVRVSTKAQADEDRYGVDVQKKAIMKYCKQNGYDIKGWLQDEITGVSEIRNDLNKLLSGYYEGKIDAVVVYKSDRMARDTKLYFYYLYVLEKQNIKLLSTVEEFDEGSDMANIYRAILQFVAEQERKNIQLRTAAGKRVKAEQGGWLGGNAPLGYFCFDKELAYEPKEAKIVRTMFRLKSEGYSIRGISDKCHEMGMHSRNRKRFAPSSIKGVLDNREFYEGWIWVDGKRTKGKHKPILKENEWN